MPKLWQCPKCKRQFAKQNQSHSCAVYPLEKHFKNKAYARTLFDCLEKEIVKKIGPLKIESLPCCIHFVSSYTFGCCYVMRDKIRLHFVRKEKIKDKRVNKWSQMSSQKYLYEVDIADKKELDAKLTKWLKEAYYLKVM